MLSCRDVKLSRCRVVQMSRCQVVELLRCQIVELLRCQIVELPRENAESFARGLEASTPKWRREMNSR